MPGTPNIVARDSAVSSRAEHRARTFRFRARRSKAEGSCDQIQQLETARLERSGQPPRGRRGVPPRQRSRCRRSDTRPPANRQTQGPADDVSDQLGIGLRARRRHLDREVLGARNANASVRSRRRGLTASTVRSLVPRIVPVSTIGWTVSPSGTSRYMRPWPDSVVGAQRVELNSIDHRVRVDRPGALRLNSAPLGLRDADTRRAAAPRRRSAHQRA
jgi:hypothetical protein